MNTTTDAKSIDIQLNRSGREHPVWFVTAKVNGEAVEMVQLRRKGDFVRVAADLANKYR